nr:Chain L, ALA-SER-LYS-LEU-GLY-LEU-ALA-ARG [Homo sapiens]8J6D_D Chain D, EP141 peptide agonist [Homo sapiens]
WWGKKYRASKLGLAR